MDLLGFRSAEEIDLMANIPPPPAGFTLDAAPPPSASGAIPPPPAGFTMDAPQGQPSTAMDMLKSAGSGIAQGTASLIGLPGTIGDAFNNSMSAITGMKPLPPSQVGGQSLNSDMSSLTGGATDYKPQTTPGKYAHTAGEFIPGAVLLGGSGGVIENAARYGVVPGVASEAAGQTAQKYAPSAEPYARLAAALLAPTAVEGAVRGVNALVDGASSLSPKIAASQNLAEALAQSGSTPADVQGAMAANPRLSPMDVNPNLQQMGMNLATQGGAPRAILNDVVQGRMAGAKDAVSDVYDSALGQTPNVKSYLDNLKATTQANGKKAFGDALGNAGPVDVSPVLDHIDKSLYPGVQAVVGTPSALPNGPVEQALARVRSMLANDNESLTDASRLHTIQSGLRTDADTLSSSAVGQDRLVGNALSGVRQKIIDQIDSASGGKFRPAQAQYASDSAIQEAFDKGRTIFNGGGPGSDATLYNRPEYWQSWKNDASAPELAAAKVGVRVASDNMINSVRAAAAKGTAVPEVGFNQDRLEVLLGKAETDKLTQALANEKQIAETNARLFAGSQTAPRAAMNDLTAVTKVNAGSGISHGMAGMFLGHELAGVPGMVGGMALGGLKAGAQMALGTRDTLRNALMAQAISGDASGFRSALSHGLSGPLISPTSLTDPRVASIVAALLAQQAGHGAPQPTR